MKVKEVLKTWAAVQAFMPRATEKEAKELLEAELNGERRVSVLLRLYGRYNTERTARERLELIRAAGEKR